VETDPSADRIKKPDWRDAQSGFSKDKSENKLQSKLNQTFRRGDATLYRAGYLTEPVTAGRAIEAGPRGRKIRVVEQIEELSAELETDPLGNWRSLEYREIKVPDSGSPEGWIRTRLGAEAPLKLA
jgi:hypothetical protein